MPKIMDVREIRENPASINDNIRVYGKVLFRDNKSSFFLLTDPGRSNTCKAIPVVLQGPRPDEYSKIIIYGRVMKADSTLNSDILWWEYFLEASKIKTGNDIFSDNLFYSSRQWVYKTRNWFYKKCGRCGNFIKRFIT